MPKTTTKDEKEAPIAFSLSVPIQLKKSKKDEDLYAGINVLFKSIQQFKKMDREGLDILNSVLIYCLPIEYVITDMPMPGEELGVEAPIHLDLSNTMMFVGTKLTNPDYTNDQLPGFSVNRTLTLEEIEEQNKSDSEYSSNEEESDDDSSSDGGSR
jgi:hypothetical protein